ncbi:hypothetical protein C8A00DRAFT_38575 [Chaetomidium leptoderma]|uniref:CCHC-type domain-containing protein n=1 Tax=Chaetomidium leptoderma TaxID=669021 RepID=A0AAN6VDF2_9PEZI|nr:hypothetical protein C8A00DRAFT_38575 [Chaetomidium leptoderma]
MENCGAAHVANDGKHLHTHITIFNAPAGGVATAELTKDPFFTDIIGAELPRWREVAGWSDRRQGRHTAALRWELVPRPCGCARRLAEQEKASEGLALTSKFSLTKNKDLLVLGTIVARSQTEPNNLEMATNDATGVADQLVGREEETVAAATTIEAGNGGDREVANTTTKGAGKAGKNKRRKKKSAKRATSSSAVAKSEDAAEEDPAGIAEKWAQIWELLESSRGMADGPDHEAFKAMLGRSIALSAPDGAVTAGPVCANGNCGQVGHTLAVCPVPTDPAAGDISGCFFCNVVDHEADDCPMMGWVSPATLVTHLITNRAGMPPWRTRIDWVALALTNWDMVCFTMLPLTRAFVRKVYIPGRRWEEVNGVSPITDPLFKKANLRLLKDLAKKPHPDDPNCRPRLMEASRELCYCYNKCADGIKHAIFDNDDLEKYIPKMVPTKEALRKLAADRELAVAVSELEIAKKMPKKVDKKGKPKGRRAMNKEAAAAVEEAAAGPSQQQNDTIPTGNIDLVDVEEESSSAEEEKTVSEGLLDLADAVGDVLENIRNIIKS